MAAEVYERISDGIDGLRAQILDLRIRVAQERDSILTKDEQIAMLEVYSEFGR